MAATLHHTTRRRRQRQTRHANFEGAVIFLDAVCREDGEKAKQLSLKPKGIILRAALGLDPSLDDVLEPPIPPTNQLAASPVSRCTENPILYNHHPPAHSLSFLHPHRAVPHYFSCSILFLPPNPTKKLQYELQGSLCHCCPSCDRLGRRSYRQLSRKDTHLDPMESSLTPGM